MRLVILSHIYLATLGQRPEVITIALDWLLMRYPITTVVVLHTDPVSSAIASAFNQLRPQLEKYSPAITCEYHEIKREDGQRLADISDTLTAESYYRAVVRCLIDYKQRGNTLHLMVAGGRKAMSAYALLAATTLFDAQDKVWTLLSEPELIEKRGVFHLSEAHRDKIQMVALPIQPARLAPGVDALEMSERRKNPRSDFLAKLTPQQRKVAEILMQTPASSNQDIAEQLNRTQSTIQKHLEAIYDKMVGFYDGGESVQHRRNALIALLRGD